MSPEGGCPWGGPQTGLTPLSFLVTFVPFQASQSDSSPCVTGGVKDCQSAAASTPGGGLAGSGPCIFQMGPCLTPLGGMSCPRPESQPSAGPPKGSEPGRQRPLLSSPS